MRVLGVDPGLTRCGLGVVDGSRGGRLSMVAVGVVRTPGASDTGERLAYLQDQLDADASKHLKELFNDVNQVVNSVVEANGYDIVFAYPEATTKEEAESQNYIDLKLRATAAMPFYVGKRADITEVMISTLNKYRPAPGPTPPKMKMPDMKDLTPAPAVTPTGGTGGLPPK